MAIPPESIHIPGWLFKWDFLQLEAAVTSSSPNPPFAALPMHLTVLVGKALKSPPPRHTPAPSCIEVSKQPHLSPKWLQAMPEDWAEECEDSPEHADHEPPSIAFSFFSNPPKGRVSGGISTSSQCLSHLSLAALLSQSIQPPPSSGPPMGPQHSTPGFWDMSRW